MTSPSWTTLQRLVRIGECKLPLYRPQGLRSSVLGSRARRVACGVGTRPRETANYVRELHNLNCTRRSIPPGTGKAGASRAVLPGKSSHDCSKKTSPLDHRQREGLVAKIVFFVIPKAMDFHVRGGSTRDCKPGSPASASEPARAMMVTAAPSKTRSIL